MYEQITLKHNCIIIVCILCVKAQIQKKLINSESLLDMGIKHQWVMNCC